MAHTLFDVLMGRYQNGQPLGRNALEADLKLSICDHLQRLLNGRRGVLPHLPGYGLPDVAALFEALPYSLDELTACVRQAVEQFEQRLVQVQVRPKNAQPGADRVRLEILGRSRCGQSLRFIVALCSSGQAQVALSAAEV